MAFRFSSNYTILSIGKAQSTFSFFMVSSSIYNESACNSFGGGFDVLLFSAFEFEFYVFSHVHVKINLI